jgi:hypothetical protein
MRDLDDGHSALPAWCRPVFTLGPAPPDSSAKRADIARQEWKNEK